MVLNLVGRDEFRTNRCESVEALAADPLPVAVLQVSSGDVIADEIARDVVERVFWFDSSRFLANHDDQFGLVIDLFSEVGVPRDRAVGIVHRRRELREEDGFVGNRIVTLLGVISVVESDTDDFAGSSTGACRVTSSAS